MSVLGIQNLRACIGHDKEILKGLCLDLPQGEVHAIMGPNGSGKSTLAKAIAGHDDYEVTDGSVLMDDTSILGMEPDEIARMGLFLAFQYPMELPGVSIANFIRAALQARLGEGERIDASNYYKDLYEKMDELGIDRQFTSRSVNEGFSGGEKKRCEILQMAMLQPRYCILDETDSGLDIDALRIVAQGVNAMRGSDRGILVITHYQRLLEYIVPDRVHVMWDGRIVRSGDKALAVELEEKGYDWVKAELVA
ncbi:MAG: Fe-S cluster assembly ATPase SufC [Opitutae bacterium]|jgi:Fe-S cluster assembly ATP-binding protein|nr:Fe-S cluster assembly ATPase SufC [Opitutae bacterium]|tara:strand:- start:4590 stop:5345 length:756 start_codon:yes stop_codon:yes gene_type:complete